MKPFKTPPISAVIALIAIAAVASSPARATVSQSVNEVFGTLNDNGAAVPTNPAEGSTISDVTGFTSYNDGYGPSTTAALTDGTYGTSDTGTPNTALSYTSFSFTLSLAAPTDISEIDVVAGAYTDSANTEFDLTYTNSSGVTDLGTFTANAAVGFHTNDQPETIIDALTGIDAAGVTSLNFTFDADAANSGVTTGAVREIEIVSAAPEPSTWALMLLGLGGAAVLASRQRRANQS